MIDKNALKEAIILKLDNLLLDYNRINGYCFDEYIKNISENITLEYSDVYDYEKITIEPVIVNDYGLTKYIISVENYDIDNELELGDMFYCREMEMSEKKLQQIENKTIKKRNKYLEAKPIILTVFGNKMIIIENTIFNHECFNNITHTHYYYGKTVTLETRDFNDIEPFLTLRDLFMSAKLGDK